MKLPFIEEACGSQTYLYVPFLSVRTTVLVPVNGTLVITGLAHPESLTVHLSGADMVLNRKHVKGALFGDCNPAYDIKKMLTLYRAGKLKLDELVTKQYKLSEINDGYADLEAGKNIRGVIIHEH